MIRELPYIGILAPGFANVGGESKEATTIWCDMMSLPK